MRAREKKKKKEPREEKKKKASKYVKIHGAADKAREGRTERVLYIILFDALFCFNERYPF